MKERIPVMYDRELKPEWIDYALEQSLQVSDEDALAQALRAYLREQITSPTSLRKVISQLQQAVGFRSPLSRDQLHAYYDEMSRLAPDQRIALRFRLLVESTPFVAEVVQAIRKLHVVGEKEVGASQLYDRLIAKYGDRGTIPRRVRYVLRTLMNLGVMEHRDKKWLITDSEVMQ
jgi:hypothetical protein